MEHQDVHFLRSAKLDRQAVEGVDSAEPPFPLGLRWTKDLNLEFTTPVTFFIGENGSGKSTLLEALAERSGLPAGGGSPAESGVDYTPENEAALTPFLRAGFRRKPRDGYFFRAEHQAHLADLLEERARDPEFIGDPYEHYGGESLLLRSHGEAFLELMSHRLQAGLFLMDEPEAALSPARQLSLLALIADRVEQTRSQFIIATHSPILLTYPGATILSFDEGPLKAVELEDTAHYQITREILANPEQYWKHLRPQ